MTDSSEGNLVRTLHLDFIKINLTLHVVVEHLLRSSTEFEHRKHCYRMQTSFSYFPLL